MDIVSDSERLDRRHSGPNTGANIDVRIVVCGHAGSVVIEKVSAILRRYGDPRVRGYADSPAAAVDLMQTGAWDVIVLEAGLHDLSTQTMSALVNQSGQTLPILVVGEVSGEEVVVAAVRAGAADYISLNRIDRLPAAIDLAVHSEVAARPAPRKLDRLKVDQADDAEAWYRALIDHLPVAAYTWLPIAETPPLYVGPAIEAMLGYTRAEWMSIPDLWERILHPEDRDRVTAEEYGHVELGGPYVGDYRVIAKDGRTIWIHDEAVMLADSKGMSVQVGVLFDMTERKRAEDELAANQERYRSLVEASPDGIILADPRGQVIMTNRQAEVIGRVPPDCSMLGRKIASMIAPDQQSQTVTDMRTLLLTGRLPASEYRLIRWDGTAFQAEVTASLARDEAGRPVTITAVVRDITERKRAEVSLRESEDRFRTVIEKSPVGVCITDERDIFESVNPAYAGIFGYAPEEMIGRSFTMLIPDGQSEYVDQLHEQRFARREEVNEEKEVVTRGGQRLTVFHSAIPFVGIGGQTKLAHFVQDISERKRSEKYLHHLAHHDSLTGLPNRVLFQDRLNQSILGAQRDGDSLALLLMDLDRFKEINDTFGHHYGDLLLQQFGARLHTALRESDTVARLGGDEFAVLLPSTDDAGAHHVAEKVLAALASPFVLDRQTLDVAASIGITLFPQHGGDSSSLLRRADVAMYAAKRSNSGLALYEAQQDEYSPGRLALMSDLRQALERNQLTLHYQPQLDIATGRIGQVEGLVRWSHPLHGLMAPDEFIGMAEHTGLINPLSVWVLNEALRQSRSWREAGLDIGVAVNLSARNLHDPRLVETVALLLKTWGVAPARLTVEITESAMMTDPVRALDILTQLNDMGVKVSIDDFGTGYSSLSYLKQLPVSEIKIDRSFVAQMLQNKESAFIVRAVIDLGHNLGIKVVAEGVEEQHTLDTLSVMGCDIAQGFYISRPQLPSDLAQWLASEMREGKSLVDGIC